MNISELGQVCQNLEIFISLKNQHFIIQAWMELKKISKRVASFYSSQARSYASSYISSVDRQQLRQKASSHQYGNFYSQKNSAANLHADHHRQINFYDDNRKGEMFRSFNKNSFEEPQCSIEKRANGYQKEKPFNLMEDERQLEDSDEFEDVVLDRLSKLQENINKMMIQRRKKDQSRGYIGAPISSNTNQRTTRGARPPYQKAKHIQDNVYKIKSPQIYDQTNSLRYQLSKSRPVADTSFDKSAQSQNSNKGIKYLTDRKQDQKININKIKQMMRNNYLEEKYSIEEDSYNYQKTRYQPEQQSNRSKYSFQNANIQDNKYIKNVNGRIINNTRQNYKTNMIVNRYQKINNDPNQVKMASSRQQIKSSVQISRKPPMIPSYPYHGSFKIQKNSVKATLNKGYLKPPQFQKSSYSGSNVSQASYNNSKVNNYTSYY